MTNLIHIVGPHGVGKSDLADYIIKGLSKRNRTAIALVQEGLQVDAHIPAKNYAELHDCPIKLHNAQEALHYDYLICEHLKLPADIATRKGDRIIHMELAE